MATCRGVDVSAHQGPQDWAAHKHDGVVFAFAKASEGQRSHDPRFTAHIKGIRAAGLVPGAYHFAWPNQDPQREADNYIAAVRPHAEPGFVHWLDLERYTDGRNYAGRNAGQVRAWVATWTKTVQHAFPGQRVGVYTSGQDLAAGHVPDGLPLWDPAYPWGAAGYPRAEAAPQPRPTGVRPLFWQFTSQPLDRSICYLSAAALRAWAAGHTIKEDDVQLHDKLDLGDWIPQQWQTDRGLADRTISVETALSSGYAHARAAHDGTDELRQELAGVKAQLAEVLTLLRKRAA